LDSRLLLPANTMLDGTYRIARVVGSGGFGITYEAEDINLATLVAIKEYYPFDFGDRDATMSVRPKSDRHKSTFDWGRSNFLLEARTLARFEHPSIVRVSRVFEANSTAYMVMRFEQGKNFENWLKGLGRPPTQEELDRIAAPMLDALEMMHAQNFLHRDIAPDNIMVRPDGTPVLLDFGTARRAVAEKSRALTGIVKAGYSPQEQYAADSRLQGPWSDLYAFGGTLYRAVTGKAPEEATLRFDEDRMASAVEAAKGSYRRSFLAAIDACLKIRHSERPRSVAQLRPMLLGQGQGQPAMPATERLAERTRKTVTDDLPRKPAVIGKVGRVGRHWQLAAAIAVVLAGIAGGLGYARWQSAERDRLEATAEIRRQRELDIQRAAEKIAAAAELERRDAETRRRDEETRRREEERRDAEKRSTEDKTHRAAQAERDYQEGQRYLSGRGAPLDYAKAREGFEKAAAAEHSGGMVGMGWLYQSGRGVPQDYAKAREWYEKAAALGNGAGMTNIGWLYRDGLGVPRDYRKSMDWYERGAATGNATAMLNLGWLYQNGWGAAQDYSRAREWYEKAAAKGNGAGMANIGWIYQGGMGVPKDFAKAREWFEKAAAVGNGNGMNGVGVLYQNGEGVAKDYAKAREWFEKGAAAGEGYAMNNLGRLYQNGWGMSIDYAKAREWREKAAATGNRYGKGELALMLDQEKGGPADFPRAAKLLLESGKAGSNATVQALRGDMKTWNARTRTELKRELARLGHYSGAIDDRWDDATRNAVNAYLAR
jgi:TPR repeat protein/tRNA A-37 threonylcarbamoyl transferase component Bud32